MMNYVLKNILKDNVTETVIGAVLVIVSLLGLSVAFESEKIVQGISDRYQQRNKPLDLDIIVINDKDCPYCYDTKQLISEIETENINSRSKKVMDYRSDEAKDVIMKYKIEKVPTVIIKGEIDKNMNLYDKFTAIGEVSEDVFILRDVMMPYVDIKTGRAVGNVKVTLMSANKCDACYNHEKYIAELKILGIPTSNRETIDYKSSAGQAMVKANVIENVPTFILTGDLDQYPALKKIQDYDDNVFVLRKVIAPYLDINDGKVYINAN